MEIPFRGEYDEAIVRRTTLTSFRPTRGRLIFILLMASLFLWGGVIFPLMHGSSLSDLTTYIAIFVLVCVVLYVNLVWGPKRQLQGNKLIQGPRSGTISDEGVHIENAYGRSDLPWDVFTRAKISTAVVLLYVSTVGNSLHAFPREFFASDTDWEAFVGLVRQRVPLALPKRGLRGRPWLVFLIWIAIFFVVMVVYNAFQAGR